MSLIWAARSSASGQDSQAERDSGISGRFFERITTGVFLFSLILAGAAVGMLIAFAWMAS